MMSLFQLPTVAAALHVSDFTSSNIICKGYQQLTISWYKYELLKPLYTDDQE